MRIKRFLTTILFISVISINAEAERIAYIADYDSLQIVDVTDPQNPFRLGACNIPTFALMDVFVVDTFAYTVGWSSYGYNGVMKVVNVSDPTAPRIVAGLDNIRGDPHAIYVSGNYAYIAALDYVVPPLRDKRIPGKEDFSVKVVVEGGIRIIDISNPLSPEIVASYDTPYEARDIFVVGDIIYVADYYPLEIYRHISAGIEEEDESRTTDYALRVCPNPFSTNTFISYHSSCISNQPVTLSIYDICGCLVCDFQINSYNSIKSTISVLWDGRDDTGLQLSPGVYFCRLQTGKEIFTKKVVKISIGYNTPMANLSSVGVSEPSACYEGNTSLPYILESHIKENITSSHQSDSIEFLGSVNMPDYAWGVYVQDTIAYVADRNALVTVNVANFSSPQQLGIIDPDVYPTGVTVLDTLAFPNPDLCPRFPVICVTDPALPYVTGWCHIPEMQDVESKGIQVIDTLVYLPMANEGLVIISVKYPDSPIVVGVHNTPRLALDLFVSER